MSKEWNVVAIRLGTLDNTCFVVMPFSPLFTTEYEKIIRPAIEEMGIQCVRSDEIYSKPRVMDDIWKSLRCTRFIVAELSGKNPNVLYEVGLAHAIGKPVIIITRNEDDVPFDLKGLRYLFYDTNDPFWGENLKKALQAMIENVMQEEGLSSYLDGISSAGEIIYPQKPQVQAIPKRTKEAIPKLSGTWEGSFTVGDMDHKGIMNIDQKDGELSGIMTITYIIDRTPTVVQEVFSGMVKGSSVTLNGVNYTFVQRGKSETYYPDNFDLTLSSDGEKMEGKLKDESGALSEVTFIKKA